MLGEVFAEAIQNDINDKIRLLQQTNGNLSGAQQAELLASIEFWQQAGVDLSKLAAGIAALSLGLDVNTAADTADNAARNNALFLIPLALAALKAYDIASTGAAVYDALQKLNDPNLSDAQKQDILEQAALNAGINIAGGTIFKTVEKIAGSLGITPERLLSFLGPRANQFLTRLGSTATCSFHGDTEVLTHNGYVAIRDIRVGQHKVWSRNDRTGKMAFQSVLAQYSNPYDETVYITIRDRKTGVEQTIVSNRIHPFFVQRTNLQPKLNLIAERLANSEGHVYRGKIQAGAWVDADRLRAGDRLLQADEDWSDVVAVKVLSEPLQAYNVTVDVSETFYVRAGNAPGADAVWVHNCSYWPKISFSGLNQNRRLGDLTDADLMDAFGGTGYALSSHARAQLRDSRLSEFGFGTLNDIKQIFNRGESYDAGDGAVGRIYRGVSIVMDPNTRSIITVRPGRRSGA